MLGNATFLIQSKQNKIKIIFADGKLANKVGQYHQALLDLVRVWTDVHQDRRVQEDVHHQDKPVLDTAVVEVTEVLSVIWRPV